MDWFRSEEERLAEERQRHSGLVDAGLGAVAGAVGEHMWDKHKMKEEERRQERLLEERGAHPGGVAEGEPRHHHHHGVMDVAGGVVAGAVGEHMWDKHEEREVERERAPADEVAVGRAYTEGPAVQGGGYAEPGMAYGERRYEGASGPYGEGPAVGGGEFAPGPRPGMYGGEYAGREGYPAGEGYRGQPGQYGGEYGGVQPGYGEQGPGRPYY